MSMPCCMHITRFPKSLISLHLSLSAFLLLSSVTNSSNFCLVVFGTRMPIVGRGYADPKIPPGLFYPSACVVFSFLPSFHPFSFLLFWFWPLCSVNAAALIHHLLYTCAHLPFVRSPNRKTRVLGAPNANNNAIELVLSFHPMKIGKCEEKRH